MKTVEMVISVIVPLYKGNKYCNRILRMIDKNAQYNQFYEQCKIEVLFVNDYPEEPVQYSYVPKHIQVNCFEQQQNQGIHGSRVVGIQHSKGEFIYMLDQDDVIQDNFLHSQWSKLTESKVDYICCNGWISRFRLIYSRNREEVEERLNSLRLHLTQGQCIASPGQVLFRREKIPKEWLEHIQRKNGADDWMLWILALKNKCTFYYNPEILYYHTPERSDDSVSCDAMNDSVREMQEILEKNELLNACEVELLKIYLQGYYQRNKRTIHSMFYKWMKLKNQGRNIEEYLISHGYYKVAIYGIGNIGECLYGELEDSKVQVIYGIDRKAKDYEGSLRIYELEENLPKVDMIILTMTEKSQKLEETLKNRGMICMHLEQILNNMTEERLEQEIIQYR